MVEKLSVRQTYICQVPFSTSVINPAQPRHLLWKTRRLGVDSFGKQPTRSKRENELRRFNQQS